MEKFSRGVVPLSASHDGKLDEIVDWINAADRKLKSLEKKLAGKKSGSKKK